MKCNLFFTVIMVLSASISSCNCSLKTADTVNQAQIPGPRAYIYQTNADYSVYVPVILSDDKKELNSYPAPGDLYFKGELALPLQLEKGFFLDRRGINPLAAFTKWTYAEYVELKQAPTQEAIMGMLLDTDPFVSFYDCGPLHKYSNPEQELNALILKGDFSSFQKLK